MANSTDEYWSIDNVSLHQYGWSVTTVGGSRYDLPPRRGSNLTLAYRPGQMHRPKTPDSRVINLIMWVTGADPATGNTVADPRLRWNDSWDFLRRLVWRPAGEQVELTRRWWLTVGGNPTLVTATALAEIADTMTPAMTGRTRADFTMSLLLADPYFYGAEVETTLTLDTPVTVSNAGTDTAAHSGLVVELVGPLTNPTITNATPDPNAWMTYTGAIPSGATVTVDIGQFTATISEPEVSTPEYQRNHIAKMSSSDRYWFGLRPGANLLTLTADAGSGTAVIRHRPPYV